ncbi:MAG TPA: hypothetical protein VMK13_16250 [Streptosporangiaceae bacterium]|nr:hypothetical protein [Streptosporangiaceae bacterium]
MARENGLDEKVIMACLLHDIAIAGLLSANHGYWGGLGFDGSPVAHMWRTMIWPNNFL